MTSIWFIHELYMLALDKVYLWEIISLKGIFPPSHTKVLSAVDCGQQLMITSWLLLKGFNFFPQALQIPLQKHKYSDNRYYTCCGQILGSFKLLSVKLLGDDEQKDQRLFWGCPFNSDKTELYCPLILRCFCC